MSFQALKNQVIITSLTSAGLGIILYFTPAKPISNWVVVGSTGFLVAGNSIADKSEKLANKEVAKLDKQIKRLNDQFNKESDLLSIKLKELSSKSQQCDSLTIELGKFKTVATALNADLQNTKNQLSQAKTTNSQIAVEMLEETFTEFRSQVSALIDKLSKSYSDLSKMKDWVKIEPEYLADVQDLITQIQVIRNQSDTQELISMALAVQYQIVSKGSLIKCKAYKSVVTYLSKQLIETIPIQEHNAYLEELNQAWQQKNQVIKDEYQQYLQAIQEEFNQVADTVTTAYKEDFNELIGEGMTQTEIIEKLQLELLRLNRKLEELSKPHRLPGLTEPARVGNSIIDYYLKLGYCLDAIDWETSPTGYTLKFHTDRNLRFISVEMLNDGDNPAKIKEVSNAISLPKFQQSDKGNYVLLVIETRKPEKKVLTVDDIRRLIEPCSKFGEVVKRYHESKPTLRVMTRTGGGKSIAVKNLLHHYVNHFENYEIWLSDPQHGSFEDYWNIPKIAKNPSEVSRVLELFINEFLARKNGTSQNADIPVIACFDETDKTFDKKQKQGIAQVWTEIRHRKMKLILIGQSGEVGKNGWTWDEMNNCSLLFIGDAIGTAIKHADDMGWSSEQKTKIPTTYQKVSEWMGEQNQDLPVKNHYRLGLLIDGMRFDFVEIPPALDGTFDNNKSWLVESPWQSKLYQNNSVNTMIADLHPTSINGMQQSLEPLKNRASQMASIGYVGYGCPKCQDGKFVKSKKNRNTFLYQCDSCQKWTSESVLSQEK